MFGYNGLGWRFTGARLRRHHRRSGRADRPTDRRRSTLIGGIAGLLIIADGVSFVTARTALLDVFLMVFVVAAFGALIVDRDQMRERMHVALLEGRIAETPWGPRLGVRWWRFGAGVLLGSGLRDEVVRAVLHGVLRGDDIGVRRRRPAAVPRAAAVAGNAAPRHRCRLCMRRRSFRSRVYLASYAPWFASETAVNRHEEGRSIGRRRIPAGCDPLAVAFHLRRLQVPRRADQCRGQSPPVGVETVDVADVAAAGAVCDRSAERSRLRQTSHASRP